MLSLLLQQIPDLEKELVDLKSPSAEDVSKVLDSFQNQVTIFSHVNTKTTSTLGLPAYS